MSTHKIWFHGEIQKLFIPAVTTVIFLSCMKFHSLFTWGIFFFFFKLISFANIQCINTVVYRTVASNGTCDSVRRVIAYLAFGFQAGHLFILFFFYCF